MLKTKRVYVQPRQPRQGTVKTQMQHLKQVLRRAVKTMKQARRSK